MTTNQFLMKKPSNTTFCYLWSSSSHTGNPTPVCVPDNSNNSSVLPSETPSSYASFPNHPSTIPEERSETGKLRSETHSNNSSVLPSETPSSYVSFPNHPSTIPEERSDTGKLRSETHSNNSSVLPSETPSSYASFPNHPSTIPEERSDTGKLT